MLFSAPAPHIESCIFLIRRQKVLLDFDLATLYQVETRALNQAVKRNRERFPDDFMFQLTPKEDEVLKSQLVISNGGRGGRRRPSYAFTEQGVAMLSAVLVSQRAVSVSIAIMQTFVRLRELLAAHEDIAHRLEHLEWREAERDSLVQYVFDAIQVLIGTPAETTDKRRIGFPISQAIDERMAEIS